MRAIGAGAWQASCRCRCRACTSPRLHLVPDLLHLPAGNTAATALCPSYMSKSSLGTHIMPTSCCTVTAGIVRQPRAASRVEETVGPGSMRDRVKCWRLEDLGMEEPMKGGFVQVFSCIRWHSALMEL